MAVTVHEVLTLKSFNNFKLIAGVNGLNRIVNKGGFIDHEDSDIVRDVAFRNEFIFSNLPMIKDYPEKIVDFIQGFIDAGCAGFAIKTTFFKSIPDEAIQLANQNNFPVFLFDNTYIEYLILEIEDVVNIRKKNEKKVDLIKSIETNTLNKTLIKEYALEINRHFKDSIVVCYISKIDEMLRTDLKLISQIISKSSIILQKEDSFVLIHSTTDNRLENLFRSAGLISQGYKIGVSHIISDLSNLDEGLFQAKVALKYAYFSDREVTYFEKLGVFQCLIPIMDNPHIHHYYESIINTLMEYDKRHHSELLNTAIAYIESDGDIKLTSDRLFQHNNTVRYRIRKIKEILFINSLEGMKYETLAIAIQLYKLKMSQHQFRHL